MSGRPDVLFPLFAGLQTLDGIGPKTAVTLQDVGVEKPRDILMTLPVSGVDRQLRGSVRDVVAPAVATVTVTVGAHYPPKTRGRPYRIHVTDEQTE
ncbi:MAG: ATP-dependent DNA helicase RecG, partial [Yoonia sp.]